MIGDLINRHLVQEAITKSIELKENPHQIFKRVQEIPSADRPTGEVLEDIKAELKRMADNEWNQQVGSSKGLEEAIEVAEKYMD